MKKYFIVFTVLNAIQGNFVQTSGVFSIDFENESHDVLPNDLEGKVFDRCDKTIIQKCGLDSSKTMISQIVPL